MSESGKTTDNREAWAKDVTASGFGGGPSWSDPGEEAGVLAAARWIDRANVLDVGIGGCRTTSILKPRAIRYVGVDFAPARVEAARRAHPDADIRHMDARSLEQFGQGEFDFVQFSYNGIDSVPHDDRAQILSEFHRVLRPGGALLVSTLNIQGSLFGATPWLPRSSTGSAGSVRALARKVKRGVYASATVVRAYSSGARRHQFQLQARNWHRLSIQRETGDGWGLDVLDALDFTVLAHFESLRKLRSELDCAHFDIKHIWTDTGVEVPTSAGDSTAAWFQALAVAPGRSTGGVQGE
ncbi:MAG: class I SAM-dependent methyltransferase [Lacisediminihabitans sp.]